ncbi:MAG: hypothetical protein LBR54_02740 [Oscillospiraceae bacterium]|jgi:hypothetical protein|nr:hypothetical protein [Oscillospiraceae bacterium]
MKSLKEIMREYNTSVSLPFLGHTLTVSAERNIYNEMCKKYSDLTITAVAKFGEFNAGFIDLNDLISTARSKFLISINEMLTEISCDAVSIGVHNLDSGAIIEDCFRMGHFEAFTKILDAYKSCSDGAEMRIHISNRKNSGGYQAVIPIESASDMIGYEIGSAVGEAIGDAIETGEINKAKKAIFKDESLRNELVNGVLQSCNCLEKNVMCIISKNSNLRLSGWSTVAESQKADAVFNNVMTLNLSESQKKQFAFEAITLEPFNPQYYAGFLEKFDALGNDGIEILNVAVFFNSDWAAKQTLKKIDLEYRTVQGVVLETRELADAARNDLNTYREFLEKPPQFIFRADYIDYIDKIRTLPIDNKLKPQYIARYSAQLSAFDQECRKAARHVFRMENRNPLWNGDKKNTLLHAAICAFSLFTALMVFVEKDVDNTAGVVWLGIIIVHLVIFFVVKPKKEKEIYDKLTQNGKYKFKHIISDAVQRNMEV